MNRRNGDEPRVPRRVILKSLAAGAAIWQPACGAPPLEAPAVRDHAIAAPAALETPIVVENRRLGSSTYKLARPAANGEVEGYASAVSALSGEIITLHVNVNHAQRVRWQLFRIGHYQGHGARLVEESSQSVPVEPQPIPTANPHNGLLECAWQAAFSLTVAAEWLTGYYLFKLINEDGFESYVPLIVRESGRTAPLLIQASVTTWQAYNIWGGISLYINHLPDPSPFSAPRGYKVSFDRPYAPGIDIGFVEHSAVRWIEQQGYDVAYVTNVDIDRTPSLLDGRQLFISLGHDEYWSLTERNAVQDARDQGLSLAFLGGNPAYRRIRFEESASGVERRVVTCFKSPTLDPHRGAPDTTSDYHEYPHARPENELCGVIWNGWAHLEGFPLRVTQPDHWLFEGTGIELGDSLGNVVGYEWDMVSDNGLSPAGLEILAESPVLHEYGYLSLAQATIYYPTAASFVFAAGSVGWGKGLSEPEILSPKLQRATENLLLRAGLSPEARMVVPSPARPEPCSARTALVLAGTGKAGHVDGSVDIAQFDSPAGVASAPDGSLFVCDTGNSLVRKISRLGQVTTVLGAERATRLNCPTGIVVDAQGNVFVSDTGNQRIVVLRSDGSFEVAAGHAGLHGNADSPHPWRARFNLARGLAVDGAGAIYVADFRNDAVRRIDASGVTTVVSDAGGPTAVAVGPDGTLYYAASWDGTIVRVTTDGTRTVLANTNKTYGDRGGPGADAALRPGDGLLVTAQGLFFCDVGNGRVRSVAFDEQNTVSTVLGTGRPGSGIGSGAETELQVPRGLCALGTDYVVADTANHRIVQFSL